MSHGHEHSHDSAGAWWVARPENADKIFYALVAACVGLVLFDLVYHNAFHSKHGYFSFETAIGFHAVYGFVAFLFVVISGTQLRNYLMRSEDYYDIPYTTPEGGHDHGHGHGDGDAHGEEGHGHHEEEPSDGSAEESGPSLAGDTHGESHGGHVEDPPEDAVEESGPGLDEDVRSESDPIDAASGGNAPGLDEDGGQ
jgi:hypothetical protein